MQNVGNQQFSYDSFKAEYDSDPKLQDIVKDFNKDTITLKGSSMDDVNPADFKNDGRPRSKNKVNQMAKRAVDL